MSVTPEPFSAGTPDPPPAGAAVLPARSSGGNSTFAGERIVQEYIQQGYGLYLMAGIAGAGKTQLLDAYHRSSPFLPLVRRKEDIPSSVLPTAPRSFACYPVKAGTRKTVFVDASGEDFRLLYPLEREARTLPEADAQLLKVVAKSLRGLVLVVDLERLWGPPKEKEGSGNRIQERILAWVLELLRWFRFGGTYNSASATPFHEQVTARVQRMSRWQRLPFPVQVVFSKADRLPSVRLPVRPHGIWAGTVSDSRPIYPPGEHPLLLAYHYLPLLYEALRENVRIFRFDFAHALVTDPATGAVTNETPCGVEYTLSWLLERRWGLEPSTARLVRWQRRLDALTFRRGRWRWLPEPEELDRG